MVYTYIAFRTVLLYYELHDPDRGSSASHLVREHFRLLYNSFCRNPEILPWGAPKGANSGCFGDVWRRLFDWFINCSLTEDWECPPPGQGNVSVKVSCRRDPNSYVLGTLMWLSLNSFHCNPLWTIPRLNIICSGTHSLHCDLRSHCLPWFSVRGTWGILA